MGNSSSNQKRESRIEAQWAAEALAKEKGTTLNHGNSPTTPATITSSQPYTRNKKKYVPIDRIGDFACNAIYYDASTPDEGTSYLNGYEFRLLIEGLIRLQIDDEMFMPVVLSNLIHQFYHQWKINISIHSLRNHNYRTIIFNNQLLSKKSAIKQVFNFKLVNTNCKTGRKTYYGSGNKNSTSTIRNVLEFGFLSIKNKYIFNDKFLNFCKYFKYYEFKSYTNYDDCRMDYLLKDHTLFIKENNTKSDINVNSDQSNTSNIIENAVTGQNSKANHSVIVNSYKSMDFKDRLIIGDDINVHYLYLYDGEFQSLGLNKNVGVKSYSRYRRTKNCIEDPNLQQKKFSRTDSLQLEVKYSSNIDGKKLFAVSFLQNNKPLMKNKIFLDENVIICPFVSCQGCDCDVNDVPSGLGYVFQCWIDTE